MCKCKYCGKILKRPCALGIHERTCKLNPNRKPLENHVCGYAVHQKKELEEGLNKNKYFKCKYCGKVCKNDNSYRNHERTCPKNENRVYKNGMFEKTAWNKGLTKETDIRVKKQSNALKEKYKSGEIKIPFKGKHHTDFAKKQLSEKRKKFLSENPEKVPYVLNHHSKGDSYPEKYFKNILNNNNIMFKQNYYENGYFLDFAFPDKKIYFEVDGEQHYVDKRIIEHDKKRTNILLKNGWICIDRIRWSEYKKLKKENKEKFIYDLLKKLGQ